MEWTVICVPVQANENSKAKNKGGLVVTLTDGDERIEVTRVSFTRRHSRNPDASFEEQLQAEVFKAQQAAGMINDLLDELDRKQAEDVMGVRDRVRELLGKPLTAA